MTPLTRTAAALSLGLLLLCTARQGSAEGGPVNVNTATAAELTTLQGIGQSKAQAIVEHRDKNGQFKTVDDLKLVRGIGDKMLEQLRPQVTVGDSAAAAAPPAAAPAGGSAPAPQP